MAPTTIFRAKLLVWLPPLLMAGCCANNVCDCVGEAQQDAVKLVFKPGSFPNDTSGFTSADIDTLVLQRYPKINKNNARPDVVTLVRVAPQLSDTITLNNITPFAQQGTTKLNGYSYRVRFLYHKRGRRNNAALALTIDSVQLRGSLEGNGCCTCYTNSYKAIYVRARKDSTVATNSLVELPDRKSVV